jgi:HTH-type transcriptional regulator/antitoxin HigA
MAPESEIIGSDAEYRRYLTEVDRLVVVDPESGTPDGDRLLLLARLVEEYEKRRFRFRRPEAGEMLRFQMKERAVRK